MSLPCDTLTDNEQGLFRMNYSQEGAGAFDGILAWLGSVPGSFGSLITMIMLKAQSSKEPPFRGITQTGTCCGATKQSRKNRAQA